MEETKSGEICRDKLGQAHRGWAISGAGIAMCISQRGRGSGGGVRCAQLCCEVLSWCMWWDVGVNSGHITTSGAKFGCTPTCTCI